MVDTMTVLGAAATAKLTGDRLVREFVEYVRRNARVRDHVPRPPPSPRRTRERLSRSMKPSTSRSSAARRRPLSRRSKKLSLLTDADLEAELENRRRRRARERSQFSRAMPSDKLAALESELFRLRREISRIDSPSAVPRSPAMRPVPSNTSRLSAFNSNISLSPPSQSTRAMPSTPLPSSSAAALPLAAPRKPPRGGGPPPPPPPPPPATDGRGTPSLDPERQKREKLERQKRREAKKKEREQAQSQKKLTLADIIRSAGPDPMRRLKPASKKAADEERELYEKELKEREEREKREEQQRVELEKKALAEMGKRVSPSPAGRAENKSSEDDTTVAPKSSSAEEKEPSASKESQEASPNNSHKEKVTQAFDKVKIDDRNLDQKAIDVHISRDKTENTHSDTNSGTETTEHKAKKSETIPRVTSSLKESKTVTKPP